LSIELVGVFAGSFFDNRCGLWQNIFRHGWCLVAMRWSGHNIALRTGVSR
jgi:hypothetical protein